MDGRVPWSVDVVWRRQCEIDPTGPRRGIVADVAERGGGSVDCTCSEYGDLTMSRIRVRPSAPHAHAIKLADAKVLLGTF